MTVDQLVEAIRKSTQHTYLYHFTCTTNFKSIKEQRALLSKGEMRARGIWPENPGGNQWSWDADDYKGVSMYVSLCMTQSHPMARKIVQEQRVPDIRHLCVEPSILLEPGVLFASDISNKAGVELKSLENAVDEIDFEVIYTRTNWSDPEIQARLRAAEKCEILVPNAIPIEMIPRVY